MKPWFLLFIFFPLYSQEIDLYINPCDYMLESCYQERKDSYLLLEDRLHIMHQRILMLELYLDSDAPYELKKEHDRLKKDYELLKKTIIQLKGSIWKSK